MYIHSTAYPEFLQDAARCEMAGDFTIPIEIWIVVFEQINDPIEFVALAWTCKTFAAISGRVLKEFTNEMKLSHATSTRIYPIFYQMTILKCILSENMQRDGFQ
jgi:hypothetical protein